MTDQIKPQLSHAGMWVRDMDQMVSFYTRVLGFNITDRGFVERYNGHITFMSNDPNMHHQVILAEGRPEGAPSTINQLSFTVSSLSELRVMYRRVVEEGVENLLPRNHGNAWSVYFDDPEGNNIEVYLDSPFHVPQPFGEYLEFDLSDDEIIKLTEALCQATEGYRPRAEWSAALAGEMAKSQA